MPTFIDESGSTGTGRHAHRFFRVAAVWVSAETAAPLRGRVAALRQELGLLPGHVFKFHKTERFPAARSRLFRFGLDAGMRFTACHVNLAQPYLMRAGQEVVHWHALTGVATALRPVYAAEERRLGRPLKEEVVIDRCTDGNYLSVARHAFGGLRSGPTAKRSMASVPRFQDDEGDDLLQLADLVCGAVGSFIESVSGVPNGDPQWYQMLRHRGLGGDDRFGPGISLE